MSEFVPNAHLCVSNVCVCVTVFVYCFGKLSKRDNRILISQLSHQEAKDFQAVLHAFSTSSEHVLSPCISVTSSLSPSPRPTSMDMLSQISFDDLLKDDETDHPSHPAGLTPAKLVTPRQRRTEAPCTTQSSNRTMSCGVPFAQRQFGVKKEIDEDDEQEMQSRSHSQDEGEEEEENDSSEDDSIWEEAKHFAQTSQGMPTGWMKTQVKTSIKDPTRRKEQTGMQQSRSTGSNRGKA